MRLERLDHIGVVVDDLARAQELFAAILQLPLDEKIERDDLHAAFYSCGNARIELIELLDDRARAHRLGDRPARVEHIAFEVDDLDATITTLEALGIQFAAPPRESGSFRTAFTVVESSGGIMLQFSERL